MLRKKKKEKKKQDRLNENWVGGAYGKAEIPRLPLYTKHNFSFPILACVIFLMKSAEEWLSFINLPQVR